VPNVEGEKKVLVFLYTKDEVIRIKAFLEEALKEL
jgi:hypothetical protein